MQNGQVPQHGVANKKQNGYLRCEGSPEDQGFPVSWQAPQPRTPVPEGRVPIITSYEKQRQLNNRKTKGCRRLRYTVLKLPVHKLTHTELQCRGRKKLNIWGGTKLANTRARAEGGKEESNSLQVGSADRHHCFFTKLFSNAANLA